MKSPNVRSDDPERLIRAIEFELQERIKVRKKPGGRFPFRLYGLGLTLLMIVAMLFALQFFASRLRALSEQKGEFRSSEAILR